MFAGAAASERRCRSMAAAFRRLASVRCEVAGGGGGGDDGGDGGGGSGGGVETKANPRRPTAVLWR